MSDAMNPRKALRLKRMLGAKADIASHQGRLLDERDKRVARAIYELGMHLGMDIDPEGGGDLSRATLIARAAIKAYEAKA